MENKLKAAIVGCGFVASDHIRQLKRIAEVQVVGVCDTDSKKASQFAKEMELNKSFTNLEKLLQECKPQVVHILTPPQTHKELALQCIRNGCHVLVEKPMAMDSKEASEMIKEAELANIHLGVCHNFLFVPAVVKALQMANAGEFGNIVFVDTFWRIAAQKDSNDRYHRAKWLYDLKGSVAQEIAAHPVYLLRAFIGDLIVKGVSTKTRSSDLPEDAKDFQITLESRTALACITISIDSQPVEKYLHIIGTKSSAYIDLSSNTFISLNSIKPNKAGKAIGNFSRAFQYTSQTLRNIILEKTGRLPRGHDTLIKQFYSALKGEASIPVTAKDGQYTVTILDQIWTKADL